MTKTNNISNSNKTALKIAICTLAVLFSSLFASAQNFDENYVRRPSSARTKNVHPPKTSLSPVTQAYTVLMASAFPIIQSTSKELAQMDDADQFDYESLFMGTARKNAIAKNNSKKKKTTPVKLVSKLNS